LRESSWPRAAYGLLAVLAMLAGCGRHAPEAGATGEQPRAVRAATVESRILTSDLTASGRLVPREEAAVTSQLSGYRVAAVYVDEGDEVRAGQLLARLDDTLLRSDIAQQEANLAQQRVAAEKADQEAARVRGLEESGVLSDEAIAGRRLAARTAQAGVAQARALLAAQRVREGLMEIRAPVGGRILERAVRPGDVSSPATLMFRIARDDLVELDAEIPEQAMKLVRVGQRADVILPGDIHVAGVVRLVRAEVDRATGLARARILLPRRADLRPGGFAQAILQQGTSAPVRAVPAAAVQYGAGGATVMVVGKDDRISTIPVTIGRRGGGYVELTSGPAIGAQVLTGSQGFVLDGDKVKPMRARTAAR